MDKEMAYPPGMELHGSGWRITKRVPQELLSHYAPKKFLRYQTGEADKKAAVPLCWRKLAEWAEEFQRIKTTGSPYRNTIDPDEMAYLVRLMVRAVLESDEEDRDAGELETDEGFAESVCRLESLDEETRQAISRRIFSGTIALVAEDWLRQHGYDIPTDSQAFKEVCLAFAKGRAEAIKIRRGRNAGDWVDTPPPPSSSPTAAPSGAPKLSKVIQYFMDRQDQEAPMYKKYRVATELLMEVLGDRPVSSLRQQEIDEFFGLLCKLPPRWPDKKRQMGVGVKELAAMEWGECIGPKTFDDSYMAALRPFFKDSRRVFADQGFPAHLTTDGIKYSGSREGGENKQRAMRLGELKRLYEGPEFAGFARDPEKAHCYWLPLLGLYTGARINEVCQLNPQCDIREEFGVWFFDFTEDSETDARVTKSLKNKSSKRRVPIHSELLRLGFLGYLEKMKKAGHALLFPQLPPTRGKASGKAEKWFIDFIRETGLRDDTPGARLVGFHAYRSTFLNRAMNLEIDNAEWLTGHAPEKVSSIVRGYQGEAELQKKRDILERIFFEVLIPEVRQG